jgi:hypothetical protein
MLNTILVRVTASTDSSSISIEVRELQVSISHQIRRSNLQTW